MNSATKEIDTMGKVTPDLSKIYNDLLKSEQNSSSTMPNLPPPICTDTSTSKNVSNSTIESGCESDVCLNNYDKEILNILEDLQCPLNPVKNKSQISIPSVQMEECRLSGSFVSDTVFNLSRNVLTGTEIKVLEKGLDFAPILRKLNEPELQRDFKDFCRRMRLKWNFGDEPTPFFSEQPSFSPKSSWSLTVGHPNLEVFLSQIEQELFRIPDKSLTYSNLTREEWQTIRSLADDRSIVIKKADKGSCVVVCDRDDYLSDAEKQLCDKAIYKDGSFNVKILSDLVACSNKIFKSIERKGAISEKEMKYFLYDYKTATNLGKLYFLPKIHKKLFNVTGRPIISNCGTPTEKASKFLDHHMELVMQSSWSYIKDSGDLLRKIKQI